MGKCGYTLRPDIFHIGYPRTGTTWLQKGLFPLVGDKLWVVDSRLPDIYHAHDAATLRSIYMDKPRDFGKVVIESEEAMSGGRFVDYLEFPKKLSWINPKAKIFICVRSQYSSIPSLYYLYVKKGGCLSFDKYVNLILDNNKLDYFSMYMEYVKYFSKDNVKILFFEDFIDNKKEYIYDLLQWCNCWSDIDIPSDKYRNKKHSDMEICLMRWVNILCGMYRFSFSIGAARSPELRKRFQLRRKFLFGTRPIVKLFKWLPIRVVGRGLSHRLRADVRDAYAASNDALFKELGRQIDPRYPSLADATKCNAKRIS